jgi:hypothetical protein
MPERFVMSYNIALFLHLSNKKSQKKAKFSLFYALFPFFTAKNKNSTRFECCPDLSIL